MVRIYHILFSFFILLIIAGPLSGTARNGVCNLDAGGYITSLSGTWHFRYGDDFSWKEDRFSAAEWGGAPVPGWITSPPGKDLPGYFWYRLHLTVDRKTLGDRPLFISLPRFFHASEIYFNGRLMGSRGKLPRNSTPFAWGVGGIYRIITPEHVRFDRPNVLAIRVYGGYRLFAGSLYSYGFAGPYDYRKSFYWINNLMNLLLGGFLILIAVRSFLRYGRKGDTALRHLGIFSLFLGSFLLVVWLPDNIEGNTQFLHSLQVALILGVLATLLPLGEKIAGIAWLKGKPVMAVSLVSGILAAVVLYTRYFPLVNILLYGTLLVISIISMAAGILAFARGMKGRSEKFPPAAGCLIVVAAMLADLWRVTGGGTDTGTYSIRLITPLAAALFTLILFRFVYRGEHGKEKKEAAVPGRSQLKGIDTDSLETSLHRLMTEEKIYRSDSLTLQGLAEGLDVSPHQLSEYLNKHLNRNYNSYINGYRVAEAKEILTGEPKASIISIAFRVGFNSASTFYDAFKKETGMKPQQYRRENMEGGAR